MVTFTDADPFTPFENLLNAVTADSTAKDTVITGVRQVHTFKWNNAAARAAQTGMTEGDTGDQADTNTIYRYDGVAWKANSSGLVPIIPTVVGTGVTVGQGGAITFSNSSSIGVNGCFTSEFDNYMIVVDQDSNSVSNFLSLQYTVAGTPTATGYDIETLSALGSTAAAVPTLNQTSIAISNFGQMQAIELNVRSPARNVPTLLLADYFSTANPGTTTTMSRFIVGALQRASTQFDGFVITTNTGTAIGRLRIYGFNNN